MCFYIYILCREGNEEEADQVADEEILILRENNIIPIISRSKAKDDFQREMNEESR